MLKFENKRHALNKQIPNRLILTNRRARAHIHEPYDRECFFQFNICCRNSFVYPECRFLCGRGTYSSNNNQNTYIECMVPEKNFREFTKKKGFFLRPLVVVGGGVVWYPLIQSVQRSSEYCAFSFGCLGNGSN